MEVIRTSIFIQYIQSQTELHVAIQLIEHNIGLSYSNHTQVNFLHVICLPRLGASFYKVLHVFHQ
jgi:hypothetical protein